MDWVMLMGILAGASSALGSFILEEGTFQAHEEVGESLIAIGSMASMATIFVLTEYCKNKHKVYENELCRLKKLKKVYPHEIKNEWGQREQQYQEEICTLKSQMQSIQELIRLLRPAGETQ